VPLAVQVCREIHERRLWVPRPRRVAGRDVPTLGGLNLTSDRLVGQANQAGGDATHVVAESSPSRELPEIVTRQQTF
jgi:hypothetical protein